MIPMRLITLLMTMMVIVRACENIAETTIRESSQASETVMNLAPVLRSLDNGAAAEYVVTSFSTQFWLRRDLSLALRRPVDREALCGRNADRHQRRINAKCCRGRCCLFVGVASRGATPSQVYVRVLVEDDNDNEPRFAQPLWTTQVRENTPLHTRLALPVAEDADEGENAVQEYVVAAPNASLAGVFTLEWRGPSQTGPPHLVVRANIDRERLARVEFVLVARDGGRSSPGSNVVSSSRREGRCRIVVTVLDENDNEPRFERESYRFSVRESVGPGSDIGVFKVTDKDSEDNGRVAVEFAASTSQEVLRTFQLSTGPSSGMKGAIATLRLVGGLDYEVKRQYSFNVRARDHGTPSRTTQVKVAVDVMNVNDAAPRISLWPADDPPSGSDMGGSGTDKGTAVRGNQRVFVSEGGPSNRVVALVRVSDDDSPLEGINCRLDSSQSDFYLMERATNRLLERTRVFEVRTRSELDRETTAQHRLGVHCSDDGAPQLTSSRRLEVVLKDVNDCTPQFSLPRYAARIPENCRRGTAVIMTSGLVVATDRDEGVNGSVRYSLLPGDDGGAGQFEINPASGVVHALLPLDYELMHQKPSVTLTIIASDLGQPSLSTSAHLVIVVEDVNDNAPSPDRSLYTFSVRENQPVGTAVGRVNFTDLDTEPANRRVMLKVTSGSADNLFRINSETGMIVTRRKLDREKTALHSFVVVAENPAPLKPGMEHSQSSVEVAVTVDVLDENDNAPELVLRDKPGVPVKRPEVTFSSSGAGRGDRCVPFPYVFVDRDQGTGTAAVTVTTRDGGGGSKFNLNAEAGLVCVNGEAAPNPGEYRLLLLAEDGPGSTNGSKVHKTEVVLRVLVKEARHRSQQTVPDLEPVRPRDTSDIRRQQPHSKDVSGSSSGNRYGVRSNVLYIVIGSIAAALLLLLIIILVGFRRFVGLDMNYPIKTERNNREGTVDGSDCQPDAFDVNSGIVKYGDISVLKNKQTLLCRGGPSPNSLFSQQQHPNIGYQTIRMPPPQQHQPQQQQQQPSAAMYHTVCGPPLHDPSMPSRSLLNMSFNNDCAPPPLISTDSIVSSSIKKTVGGNNNAFQSTFV